MTERAQPLAVVFPGQGSQKPGMGRDFHSRFAVSREAYEEASDALGYDVAAVCFGEDARLDLTEFTQPCLVATEIAMYRALDRELGLSARWFGGHSLGEYSALCAAGVITLGEAVRLTRFRGALMQRAVPQGQGAMLAVICAGIGERDLAQELAGAGIDVDVANRNAIDQVVLSGAAAEVAKARAHLEAALTGVEHRLVELNVSAPFHSRLMRGIESEFGGALAAAVPSMLADRADRCTSNVTGGFHLPSAASVVEALTRQVSSPVDWMANMRTLASSAGRIFEVGPARPLSGFFRTLGVSITALLTVRTAERELATQAAAE